MESDYAKCVGRYSCESKWGTVINEKRRYSRDAYIHGTRPSQILREGMDVQIGRFQAQKPRLLLDFFRGVQRFIFYCTVSGVAANNQTTV